MRKNVFSSELILLKTHAQLLKKVVRYLKCHLALRIQHYQQKAEEGPIAYTDSNYYNTIEAFDRKSTSGYAISLAGGPVS